MSDAANLGAHSGRTCRRRITGDFPIRHAAALIGPGTARLGPFLPAQFAQLLHSETMTMAEAVHVSGTVGKPGAARPLPLTAWAVASPQPAATADTPGSLTVEPESRVALVSLACCAVMAHSGIELLIAEGFLESKPLAGAFGAGGNTQLDDRSGSAPNGEPDHVVVVVAGTVTCAIAGRLGATVAHLAARSRVSLVHFGVCTLSGGPYWDSPVVTADGWASLAVAIIEVAGCPPTASDLAAAVRHVVAADSARRS